MGCDSEEFVYLARVQGKRYAEIDNVVCARTIVFGIRKSVFLFKRFFAEIFPDNLSAKVLCYGLGFYRQVHIPMSKFAVVLIKNKLLTKQCFG